MYLREGTKFNLQKIDKGENTMTIESMEINKRAREIAAEICTNPFYDPDL